MKTGATLHARDPWSLLVARSLEFPLGSRVLGLTFTSLLTDLAPQDLGAKPPRGTVKGLTLAFRPGGPWERGVYTPGCVFSLPSWAQGWGSRPRAVEVKERDEWRSLRAVSGAWARRTL